LSEAQAFPIVEHDCPNGLRALLLKRNTAPVICVSVWFRVGAGDDPPGQSGLAHLLEHMMFKGSERFPKGVYDQRLHVLGALSNASTWLDRTNYYVLIGSDRFEAALELEADRLRGACLTAADLADERTVVLNELDQGRDDPATALYEALIEHSFQEHPYRRPVIGLRREVEQIQISDLKRFYDAYYQPENAFLVVVGSFDTDTMRHKLDEHFGRLPSVAVNRPSRPIESAPREERHFELRRAGGQEIHSLAYHGAPRTHADALTLDVLAQVLGHGRTSRLYRSLVDKNLAVHVSAENLSMPVDPFLFMIDIEPADGVAPEVILEVYDREVARLAEKPVSERELQRARKRARVDFAMRRDRVSALAFLIGEFEVAAGWQALNRYLDELDQVTPDDIIRSARTYLSGTRRIRGRFLPTGGTP